MASQQGGGFVGIMNTVNIFLKRCGLFFIACLFIPAVHAQIPAPDTPKVSVTVAQPGDEVKDDPSLRKPILYSLTMMAIGYPILFGTDQIDKPSVHRFEISMRRSVEWDHDSYVYNFILHPLWGSETYLRAREVGFSLPASIAFSFGCSAVWEFLIESWSERPSKQDLIFTTSIGWIIGELRYQMKKRMSPKDYWFVDPINTLLEKCNITFGADKSEKVYARMSMKIKF